MTSEVVLLISILCLVNSIWCGNYGLRMGHRHSNDQILHNKELLSNKNDSSNETIIEYVYTAEKPVTFIQLHTETNICTDVTFINSTKIYIKLSNFESLNFNATLTVYGFPWYPDGPEPDVDIPFLLQPSARKSFYLDKSSVEESNIVVTNGAYMSKEIDDANGYNNVVIHENDNSNIVHSDLDESYDYDYSSTLEETTGAPDERKPASIIDIYSNSDAVNRSVAVVVGKINFFLNFLISFFVVFVV